MDNKDDTFWDATSTVFLSHCVNALYPTKHAVCILTVCNFWRCGFFSWLFAGFLSLVFWLMFLLSVVCVFTVCGFCIYWWWFVYLLSAVCVSIFCALCLSCLWFLSLLFVVSVSLVCGFCLSWLWFITLDFIVCVNVVCGLCCYCFYCLYFTACYDAVILWCAPIIVK